MTTSLRSKNWLTGRSGNCAFVLSWRILGMLALCCLPWQVARAALAQPIVQQFYVPLPEASFQTALKAIDTTGTAVGNNIQTTIAIAIGSTNTVVVYDQWEDGFENDINSPAQSTTQIWGDGNLSNGVAPGYATDLLSPGNVILLTNVVSLPRNPAVTNYDGRDRIASTKPVTITRIGWGVVPGTVLMSGAEVYDTTRWGTAFEIPVGTNTTPTIQNFSYSSVFIMASQNGTVIQVDTNGDGTVDLTATLNQGDNYFVNGGVQAGATITATQPVQVDELTGRIGSTYQSRTFAIRPIAQWDSTYYAPVGTTLASEVHNVFLFNPYTTNLFVRCDTRAGTTNVTVPPNGNYKFPMPLNSGARFFTTNSVPFYAVGANDTGGAATANATHDWGYSLLPASALTPVAVAGWAPGSDGNPPSGNGSPLWVTPTQPTTLYVNYSGNPTNGPLTAPNGQKYDTSFSLTALQSQTIYNATTKSMSGARLFTVDGTTFTAAWGEDSSKAGAGSPYLDVGTSLIPFPVPVIYKSSVLKVDSNSDSQTNPGDTLEYTIRVSNQGMLELGDVLVLDPLPPTLTYVPHSTLLNGVAVADNLVPPAATVFPLDESGLSLQDIPVGGYSEIKYRTVINQGAGSITNYVATTTGDGTQTNSTTLPIVSTNAPAPTCSMAFSDSAGNTVTTYAPNASLYVTIANSSLNTLPGTAEAVTVLVKNNSNGDQEFLTLTETGGNTGVFRNSAALASSATAGASQQDGTLYAQSGHTLEVNLVSSICSAATATVSTPSATKKLYLSDTNQALDRIDPVATSDSTTTNTVVLGGTGSAVVVATTSGGTAGANAGSLTISHTTSSGANRLMIVGVGLASTGNNVTSQNVSNITYNGTPLTLLTNVIDGSNLRVRAEVFYMVNPPSGTANVIITTSNATQEIYAEVTTFTNVNQTTPLGPVTTNGLTTANPTAATNIVTSAVNELVYQIVNWDGNGSSYTITPGTGQTSLWNTGPSTYAAICGASTKPGPSSGTSSTNYWSINSARRYAAVGVSIKSAGGSGSSVTGTAFTQTPTFCSGFSLPSGGSVTITNYISNITGTIPANPDVVAILKYGTTPFITLGSPTYYSANGILVWSGTLSSNVSIASGQAITYAVTNNATTNSFQIDFDSSSKPSSISLPTTTIISVNSLGFYAAAYPGATAAASALSGQTVYIRATVSDPFGSNDVNRCLLTITDPLAGVTTVTLSNVQMVASDTCSRTYETSWLAGSAVGSYSFRLDAFEGTEGTTNSQLATLFVNQLDLGTPSTTQFTYSTNGVQTNSYYSGTNIWVRVIDLNRNTDSTTTNTVAALITVSTGDRETLTLSETGTNTGVFIGFLPSNTSTVTTSNGNLNVSSGATLTVTYTDATDATDVTSDTATIKPATAGTAAVSVLKTLVSPANGIAEVGSTVQFNIQVANSGDLSLATVTLTDTNASNNFLFTSASVSPNSTVTNTGNILSNAWNNLGPLAVGATTNISVSFQVLAAGSLTNYARVFGTASAGPSSASVTGYRTALTIAKTLVTPASGTGYIGDTVVFRIALTNTGSTTITNLPLEDNYSPGALQYVASTTTPSGAGGGQILWTNLGSLAAGAYTNIFVTNTAVGVSSPTVNNAAVNYGTDNNGYAVPPVQSSTNLYILGGSIGTNVWFDANANAVYDAGDSPLSGVIVFIDVNHDGVRRSTNIFATTDNNGYYLLPSLAAGNYDVRVDTNTLPAGVRPTFDRDGTNTANVASTNLTSGQNLTSISFGYTGSGSISGYVWYDANGNGATNNEPALSGVRVFIDANGNGQWETNEFCLTNTSTGFYTFSNLVAGTYNIAVDYTTLPCGTASTCTHDRDVAANGTTPVTLTAGQNVTDATFGFQGSYSLGNWVFDDWNNDGNRDNGENGISNVVLKLFTASGGSPTGNELITQTNVSLGFYRFDGLMPGSYVVVVDMALSTNLIGYVSSTGTNTDLTLAGDNKDHGKDTPVSVGSVVNGIASVAVTLGAGLQPLTENVANTTPMGMNGPGGDANDNLVLDFGFTPTYSIGNRVFADNGAGGGTASDGILNGSEAGIQYVGVHLKNSGGTVVATTNTDANGYYRFDNLSAGSYSVFLAATNFTGSGALLGKVSSTSTKAGDKGDKGLDDPNPAANGVSSASVTLGPSLTTGETDIGSGAGAHGLTGDAYDDLTIDFGMVVAADTCSIGSLVWHDANNNGLWASGEPGIAGVTIEVWKSDMSGNPLATTTSASDGTYWVGGLNPGTYRVRIPSSNFGTGQPLETTNASSTIKAAADDNVDNDNNGAQSAAGLVVLSPVITLSVGGEPVDGGGASDESGPGASLDNNAGDTNGNMTVDFGFYAPGADQANLCSLGSLVWKDANNNGVWDSGEPGIAGVTLELWQVNTNTGVSNYWAATVSQSDGTYFFHDLPSGTNWLVHIPATNFSGSGALTTYPKSSGTPVNADNQTDNDNNGIQTGGVGTEVWSQVINLTAGNEPANNPPSGPTGEFGTGYDQDNAGSYVDANGDMTVDFGFTPTYSIGNRIYHDPDNDGQPDLDNLDEGGFEGVHLYVFTADGSGSPTGSSLGTRTTDANGFYRFDGLVAGTYVVVVDQTGSSALDGYVSVTGWSANTTINGDIYDHGKDTPVTVGGIVNGIASVPVTLGPGLQPVGEGTATGSGANGPTGDANDNLVIDFGFMPLYSIGNRVFLDTGAGSGITNNGLMDGTEPGVSNVVMMLFAADGSGNPTGSPLGSTNSDTSGYYRFDGLHAGTYVVVVDQANSTNLAGYVSSTGHSTDTTVAGDLKDHGADVPVTVVGFVTNGIVSTPVTMGGVIPPLGEATGTGAGAHGPNGDIADNLTLDFGFALGATISGSVIEDLNGNGVKDSEDTGGVNGVTIVLTTSASVPVATNTTSGNGAYLFSNIPAGSYLIVETDPSGWSSTADTDGANDNVIAVTVVSGQASSSHNFLEMQPGSITGHVLVDVDGDGSRDAEDTSGIGGVSIALQTSDGTPVTAMQTDASGSFGFTGVWPGNYKVVATDPAGWTSTGDSDGGSLNQIAVVLTSGLTSSGYYFLDKPVTNIWNPAGTLACNITNAAGYPPGEGYSVVNYAGYLDIQATTGSPFAIHLATFDGTLRGAAANFDNNNAFTWTIATASFGVLNFDPAKFVVDTSYFTNDLAGGTFSVALRDNSVLVLFTPNGAPVANQVVIGRAWGTFLRVPISLVLEATTDPNNDPRALHWVGGGTNWSFIATNDTEILFAPTNNFSESFSYAVRDVRAAYRAGDTIRTATNLITVSVTNAWSSVNSISNNVENATVTIAFAGVPTYHYVVERSSDLSAWTTVQTITAPAAGVWIFTDGPTPPPPNPSFYRLRQDNNPNP